MQFTFLRDEQSHSFDDLVARVRQFCIRTLRRQVTEYIKYTERKLITQEFEPTPKEQEFYDKFSAYLQRDKLWAIPNSGRPLISMVLWKLLASSTSAIAGTLEKLLLRIETMHERGEIVRHVKLKGLDEGVAIDSEEELPALKSRKLTAKEMASLKSEIEELRGYLGLVRSIYQNAKGDALLIALDKGFDKLKDLKAPQKAVIFTESRRTQLYIADLLSHSKWSNKFVLYHGGLSPKKQAEIINIFRGDTQILIATESAAEGLNLQFCAMVVNYDLPWNPQRIEQRIGRCHRYGQNYDVIVINFLNQNNLADKRVYELLCDKFQLFEGVFGASDGILGTVDTLDFEKRIAEIYSKCRTAKEIEKSFAELRESLAPQIDEQMSRVKQKLLENFDEEVVKRLKINADNTSDFLLKFDNMLWNVTRHVLGGGASAILKYADFDEETHSFRVTKNPYYNSKYGYKRHMGYYQMSKTAPLSERYRLKCSLAQTLIFDCMYNSWQAGSVIFDLTNHTGIKFKSLASLVGKSGHLTLYNMEIMYSSRRENRLVFAGFCTENGKILTRDQCEKMFEFSGQKEQDYDYKEGELAADRLKELYSSEQERVLAEINAANECYFKAETEKLTKWANDKKLKIERKIKTLDNAAGKLKAELRGRITLPRRIEIEDGIDELEKHKKSLYMRIFEEQVKVDDERDKLIEQTKEKLNYRTESKHIFSIKWRIV